jgi:G3E family GTPase
VHVVTGFLGSGKTTLLNGLLADPAMKDTIVLINEFGDVGLDHLLVREVAEDVLLLGSGCLCCTVRDDLVGRLAELHAMRASSEIPAFSKAVVETTGLADPAPIMQALLTDPLLVGRYALGNVLATVDAVNGLSTLARHREARNQLALADTVVLTKNDLVEPPAALSAYMAEVNAAARVVRSSRGRCDAAALLDDPPARPASTSRPVEPHLGRPLAHGYRAYGADGGERHHDADIVTFTVRQPGPVSRENFVDWLELLLINRGQSILRVKGLVDIHGEPGPVVVQGVQHVLYPLEALPGWPPGGRGGWLVFIARDLAPQAIERSLGELCDA